MNFINKIFERMVNKILDSFVERYYNSQKTNINLNPNLKSLLEKWSIYGSKEIINPLYDEIMFRAKFLSVVKFSETPQFNDDGSATFKQQTIMQFPMIRLPDGANCYPAFTDWTERSKWTDMLSFKTIILTFDDFAEMVLQSKDVGGVVMNPFGVNLTMDRELIAKLKAIKHKKLNGISHLFITKEINIMVDEAKEYPEAMVEEIFGFLKNKSEVKRAWLRMLHRDNQQGYLLVVEFSGDKDMLFSEIASVASPYLNNMYIDMVPYQEGFGKIAVKGAQPFYERE